MKSRDTIFDSTSEQKVFKSLLTRWSPNLILYPQLPFSKLIQADPQQLKPGEREYFYKTNVDYTFCEPEGRPILSIEFDGIGGGFSRNGTYIQVRETSDPYRKLKMDFKLRLAQEVSYPFVVVSYEETDPVDEEDSLTILDSIIGQFLASKVGNERIEERYQESKTEIDQMIDDERDEILSNLVIDTHLEAQLDHDPVTSKASEYSYRAHQEGAKTSRIEHLYDPPLPELVSGAKDSIEPRAKALVEFDRAGCRIVINTPKVAVVREIWIRNFGTGDVIPSVYIPHMAENIAKYLAYKKAYNILKTFQG